MDFVYKQPEVLVSEMHFLCNNYYYIFVLYALLFDTQYVAAVAAFCYAGLFANGVIMAT